MTRPVKTPVITPAQVNALKPHFENDGVPNGFFNKAAAFFKNIADVFNYFPKPDFYYTIGNRKENFATLAGRFVEQTTTAKTDDIAAKKIALKVATRDLFDRIVTLVENEKPEDRRAALIAAREILVDNAAQNASPIMRQQIERDFFVHVSKAAARRLAVRSASEGYISTRNSLFNPRDDKANARFEAAVKAGYFNSTAQARKETATALVANVMPRNEKGVVNSKMRGLEVQVEELSMSKVEDADETIQTKNFAELAEAVAKDLAAQNPTKSGKAAPIVVNERLVAQCFDRLVLDVRAAGAQPAKKNSKETPAQKALKEKKAQFEKALNAAKVPYAVQRQMKNSYEARLKEAAGRRMLLMKDLPSEALFKSAHQEQAKMKFQSYCAQGFFKTEEEARRAAASAFVAQGVEARTGYHVRAKVSQLSLD